MKSRLLRELYCQKEISLKAGAQGAGGNLAIANLSRTHSLLPEASISAALETAVTKTHAKRSCDI
jgi:hypothetical protein